MDATASSPAPGDDSPITLYPGGTSLSPSQFSKPLHLAIGMFDGVHLGHQAVIQQAIRAVGKESGECSGVLTFDPHPSHVLYPDKETPLLMPLHQRIERILRLGVQHVFVQSFNLDYAAREADSFVASLQELFPGLQSLHVGENFRFGARRSGDIQTLKDCGGLEGIRVHALERERFKDDPISSSSIRKALAMGDIREVNAMLGYPYTIQGGVVPGKQVGRGLGFPTLNIPWAREATPRFGVYRVAVCRKNGGKVVPGIANYGLRPTVEKSEEPLLEVHLFDDTNVPRNGDLIRVALLDFLRPEKEFSSVEELREQIEKDVHTAGRMPLEADQSILDNF